MAMIKRVVRRRIKRLSVSKDVKQKKVQLLELIEKEGMNPYNAAIRLGISHHAATIFARDYSVSQMFVTPRDMMEQEGITIRDIVKRIIKKSGLFEEKGIPGAQRVISAQVIYKPGEGVKPIKANGLTTDFIDVNDERVQFEYLKELLEITGVKDKVTGEGLPGDADKTFNIQVNVFGDEPKQSGNMSPEIIISEVDNGGEHGG